MIAAYAWVLAIALMIALLVIFGRRTTGPLRYLMYLQATYWAIGYVARPLVLLVVNPRPRLNDSIADPRIAGDGYAAGLTAVLPIVAFGLAAYVAGLLVLTQRSRPASADRAPGSADRAPGSADRARFDWRYVAAMYVLGWICRLALLDSIDNPATASIAGVAPLAVAILCICTAWNGASKPFKASALIAVAIGEGVYSVLIASKTPLMAFILFLVIGFGATLRSARPVIAVSVICVSLFSFSFVQTLKNDDRTNLELDAVTSTYPSVVRPMLPVLRRFDLQSAATDAYFAQPGRWINGDEYISRLQSAVFPKLATDDYVSAGIDWAREVRSFTTPMGRTPVSLADGFIAEGYAMYGYVGVAVEALVLAFVVALLAAGLRSSRPFPLLFALSLLTLPAIFERGLLGITEAVGQMLQVTAVAYVLALVMSAVAELPGEQHNAGPKDSTPPSINPAGGRLRRPNPVRVINE
jgi:hypothetical protein